MEETLPHRDQDVVMTLYSHYYIAADLMFKNYKKLNSQLEKDGRLSRNRSIDWRIYLTTWLGYLAVTAEGFRKIGVRKLLNTSRPTEFEEVIERANMIGKMLKEHDDALRTFRNNIFHLRDDADGVTRFFREKPDRLSWAEELHTTFEKFFSSYRISFLVHCVRNARGEEASGFVDSGRPRRGRVRISSLKG